MKCVRPFRHRSPNSFESARDFLIRNIKIWSILYGVAVIERGEDFHPCHFKNGWPPLFLPHSPSLLYVYRFALEHRLFGQQPGNPNDRSCVSRLHGQPTNLVTSVYPSVMQISMTVAPFPSTLATGNDDGVVNACSSCCTSAFMGCKGGRVL